MNYTRPLYPVVLIVDDDHTLHLWATRYLSQAGFIIISCFDGAEGIEAFQQHSPDIALIDISMPTLDGFEVCVKIRGLETGKNAPLLMMTVTEDAKKIAEAYAAGATDFVVKPINWEILIHRLRYMVKAGNVLKKLEISERRLSKAKQMAGLGDWEWQMQDNGVYWSEEIYRMVGQQREQFKPDIQNFKNFIHTADIPHVSKNILRTIKTKEPSNIEFRMISTDKKEYVVSQQIEPLTNRQSNLVGLTGTIQDITERKHNENRIRHLAYLDEVTQLPNRMFFLEFLGRTIKLAKRNKKNFAILFFDLDGFKGINDSYGHQAGDQLLREISKRLTVGLRCSDLSSRFFDHIDHKVDVARLGGDEFIILLNDLARPEDAAVVAQRVNAWITKPVLLGDRQAHIGASMGITVFPYDGEDSETLLKNADMAMYHAKKMGKGHYQFFQEAMAIRAKKRLEMESHMNLAIQKNELLLHFQPIVDSVTEQLIGAEALLRWHSAELGFMPPNDFISFAEENGMINQFGEWVIRNVCRQYKLWQSENAGNLTIAINLSCMQFNQPTFIPMIADIIREHHVDPSFISFELTESMIMMDTDNMLDKLRKLKNWGSSYPLTTSEPVIRH